MCLQREEWEQAEEHATDALQINRDSAKALFFAAVRERNASEGERGKVDVFGPRV